MNARAALALASCIFAVVACGHAPSDTEAASSSAAATEGGGFVGCRPSAGECRYSCPDGRFEFLAPDPRCVPDSPEERGACVCGSAPEPPPQAPEGQFVGCRPSAGECANSCPTRRGMYVEHWTACPEAGDPIDMHGGCFCR